MDVAILVIWAVFWVGWLIAAFSAKPSVTPRRPARPIALLILVVGGGVIRAVRPGGPSGLMVQSSVVRGIGAALVLCGLGIAVWAAAVRLRHPPDRCRRA